MNGSKARSRNGARCFSRYTVLGPKGVCHVLFTAFYSFPDIFWELPHEVCTGDGITHKTLSGVYMIFISG